jgi:cytochrome P450
MSSIINARNLSDAPRALPGPRGLPLLGSVPAMLRAGPFAFIERCWREYGDMFQIPTLGRDRIIVVTHPNELERVLTHADIYVKDKNYDPVRPLIGNGLVASTGALWVKQRKLIQPTFNRSMLRGYTPTMVRCLETMLARWQVSADAGEPIEVYAEMARLTHHIVGLTLFGLDITGDAAAAQAVADGLHVAGERVNSGALALPLAIPTPSNLRFRRAVETLDRLIYKIIADARARPPDPDAPQTLLRLLLDARDEDGKAMTDLQLRDELVTQYVAGQETTALVMSWAFYLLSGRTDVIARMRSEADGLPADTTALEALDGLTYTRMVLDEVQRLRPAVWALTRMAVEDDCLRGHPIPAGTTVMFGIYFAHRHPEFWDDPEAFRPERFTPERIKARHHHAYVPFIAGPRTCIGRRFAIYESLITLSAILRRFDVDVIPGQQVGMKVGATCHPDRPIMARLRTVRRA